MIEERGIVSNYNPDDLAVCRNPFVVCVIFSVLLIRLPASLKGMVYIFSGPILERMGPSSKPDFKILKVPVNKVLTPPTFTQPNTLAHISLV